MIRCVVPGCGGEEFMPATPDGTERPAYSFERVKGKLVRRKIGDVVICLRCDGVQVILDGESFMTQRTMRLIEGNRPARAMGGPADDMPRMPRPGAAVIDP